MASSIELFLFTIGPLVVMAAALVYTVRGIQYLSDYRPVLLVALLGTMMLHQVTEFPVFSDLQFFQPRSKPAEVFETGANVLASMASYLVVHHLEELRTAEVELETANEALRERSTMVNVLHRILRHNVRNDVNIIAGHAAFATARVDDQEILARLETIQQRANNLERISDQSQRIRQLLSEESTEMTTVRLPEALEDPIETIVTDAPLATITLDEPESTGLTARAPAMFHLALADVLKQIVAYNEGAVAIEVTVTSEPSRSDDGEWIVVRVDDDGDGLPDLDISTIQRGDETPLMHAEGLALWCLSWAVDRAGGTLDFHTDDATIEVHLPRSGSTTD